MNYLNLSPKVSQATLKDVESGSVVFFELGDDKPHLVVSSKDDVVTLRPMPRGELWTDSGTMPVAWFIPPERVNLVTGPNAEELDTLLSPPSVKIDVTPVGESFVDNFYKAIKDSPSNTRPVTLEETEPTDAELVAFVQLVHTFDHESNVLFKIASFPYSGDFCLGKRLLPEHRTKALAIYRRLGGFEGLDKKAKEARRGAH